MGYTMSNSTEPLEAIALSNKENIILLSISILLIIIGFWGNILICVAFYAVRQIRTIPHYFIVSLSVADILLLISWTMWVVTGIMNLASPGSSLPMLTYNALISNDIMCGSASMFNMAAVSFDRYLAITQPLTYNCLVTHKRAVRAIALTWFLSIVTFVLSWIRMLMDTVFHESVMIFFAIFCDFLPLCCMIYSYVNIIIAARVQLKKMKYLKRNQSAMSKTIAKDIRLAMNLLMLVGPQLIFWGTFYAITLYETFCVECWELSPMMNFVIGNMIYLVSVLNPYIFIMVTRDLRKIVKSMMVCKRRRNLESSRDSILPDTSVRMYNSSVHRTRSSQQSEVRLITAY